MKFRYGAWTGGAFGDPEFLRRCSTCITSSCCRPTATSTTRLDALEQIGERYGFFDKDFSTSEKFKQWLKQNRRRARGRARQARFTSRGERAIRRDSLQRSSAGWAKSAAGDHRVPRRERAVGPAAPRRARTSSATRRPTSIHRHDRNAIRRAASDDIDVERTTSEVFETEHLTSCATVLLLDVSHSMILYGEDRITPAARAAGADRADHHALPKDELYVVLFGRRRARGPAGESCPTSASARTTRTRRAGLQLAQRILARRKTANKQVVMITTQAVVHLRERAAVQDPSASIPRSSTARSTKPPRAGAGIPDHDLHGHRRTASSRPSSTASPAQPRARVLRRPREPGS